MKQARIIVLVGGIVLAAGLATILAQPKVGCATKIEERIVQGSSLAGLLEDGETVQIQFGYYSCHTPKRGDLVLFNHPGNSDPLIKIVQAVPGDHWRLEPMETGASRIIVNNKVLTTVSGEPYEFKDQQARLLGLYIGDYKGVVPADAYLILGTDPAGSNDSSRFGLVSKDSLIGKAGLGIDPERNGAVSNYIRAFYLKY